jgi:arginyl-tRNA synthetase
METDKKRKKSRMFLAGIREQIREKEEVRMQERRGKYQEGSRLIEEAKKRDQKLQDAKSRKFNELR